MSDATAMAATAPPTAPATSEILAARGLTKTYRMGRETIEVLKGVDLTVLSREMVALVGASGAGKSTLIHILGLLERPDAGELRYFGDDVTRASAGARARLRNRHLGFIFQFYHLIPELSALQNVCLGQMMVRSVWGYLAHRRSIRERAAALLGEVGLKDRLRHRPAQLSGGERQRVAIARALMSDPSLVFADEPTGNLDSRTATGILDLLWRINETRGIAFLLVTHNDELAARADRRVRVVDGRVVHGDDA